MPLQVRELTEDEIRKYDKQPGGERARIAEEYRDTLAGIETGKWIEVTVPEGDKKLTVKNRLNRAAGELKRQLLYRRTNDDKLIFQIIDAEQTQMDLGDVPTNGQSPRRTNRRQSSPQNEQLTTT